MMITLHLNALDSSNVYFESENGHSFMISRDEWEGVARPVELIVQVA